MPVQEAMIARLRNLCLQDEHVVAALLYGSFTRGEGDALSDIEAALFFVDDALRTLNQQAWVQQIAPVALYFDDDFGHHTAIFTNLIRGEFHFEPASAKTPSSHLSCSGSRGWLLLRATNRALPRSKL